MVYELWAMCYGLLAMWNLGGKFGKALKGQFLYIFVSSGAHQVVHSRTSGPLTFPRHES